MHPDIGTVDYGPNVAAVLVKGDVLLRGGGREAGVVCAEEDELVVG